MRTATTGRIFVAWLLLFPGLLAANQPDVKFPARPRQPDRVITLEKDWAVSSLAISADGRRAFAHIWKDDPTAKAEVRDQLLEIDSETGRIQRTIPVQPVIGPAWGEHMLLTPKADSAIVYADTFDRTAAPVRQIDVASGQVIHEYVRGEQGPGTLGWAPAISNDGAVLYTSYDDGKVAWLASYDLKSGAQITRKPLQTVGNSPAGECVHLFAYEHGVLAADKAFGPGLWDAVALVTHYDKGLKPVGTGFRVPDVYLKYCGVETTPICANDHALYVVTGEQGGEAKGIEVWDISLGRRLKTITAPRDLNVRRTLVSQDNRVLIAAVDGPRGGNAAVYDLQQKKWVDWLNADVFGDGYHVPAFSPRLSGEGKRLVAMLHDVDHGHSDRIGIFDLPN